MRDSLIPSFLESNVSESLRSLTKNEPKMSDVSKSLWSLTKNELIAHFFEQIAHLLVFRKKQAIRSENQ